MDVRLCDRGLSGYRARGDRPAKVAGVDEDTAGSSTVGELMADCFPWPTGPFSTTRAPFRDGSECTGQIYPTNAEAKTSETIVMTLMRIFIAGPAVSLKGSPTVSPITAALCGSEPFPPW